MLNYSANGPSGYNLTNSLRFRSSASAYLSRTPASASNQKTWTWSGWVKRGDLASEQMLFSAGNTYINLTTGNLIECNFRPAATSYYMTTTQVFRDPSAWYHIVVVYDSTQATAANRAKMYINGNQVSAFSVSTYTSIPQNQDATVNSATAHNIGRYTGTGNQFDGYMTEVNFVDGQALTPSSFGNTNSTTGVWQPAKYTGTYGNNGFYLNFSSIALTSGSNTGLGKDNSGNGNYWNTNNISVTAGTTYDAMTDVPTLTSATVANYCVLNPLNKGTGTLTVTDGNLQSAITTFTVFGSMAVSSGKWYWEITIGTNGNYLTPGIAALTVQNNVYLYNQSPAVSYYGFDGSKYVNGTNSSYGSTFTANDIIGIAFDADSNQITFYKNNVSQGAITGLTSGQTWTPAISTGDNSASRSSSSNFGQRPFSYTPPSGFVALNTFNLPSSTIPQGNKYMDATLATGNNSTQVITNAAGFKPDFVWMKIRSASENHIAYDSVRGVQQYLVPNLTLAEGTLTSGLTSFNSNGFTLGNANPNYSGSPTFVAWQWQAGQGSTSSNTSGTITSTVSVNATAGFSVANYVGNNTSGATVGHGLGVAPSMIIVKNRDQATAGGDSQSWFVYHRSIGATGQVTLNTTGAVVTNAEYWNNTAPSATVFSLGNGNRTNFTGDDYIAYCWAEIAGFSAFGSYTGNGSANGPFVYLGFRPKFIILKRTDTTGNWSMYDSTRNPYNAGSYPLFPNLTDAESASTDILDWLSNGFKMRSTNLNNSGGTFIYMAFAENPFKNALAK